jgi:hypothetical protein
LIAALLAGKFKMLNVRKLAAIDLYFLGSKLILTEFGLGIVGLTIVGWFTLRTGIRREHSAWLTFWGVYMLGLGMNYVPLFLQAFNITLHKTAREEIADELPDRRAAARKYRRQSVLILVPFLVIVLAIIQEFQRRRGTFSRELS